MGDEVNGMQAQVLFALVAVYATFFNTTTIKEYQISHASQRLEDHHCFGIKHTRQNAIENQTLTRLDRCMIRCWAER